MLSDLLVHNPSLDLTCGEPVENLWKADGNSCGYQERGYDKYMTKETILLVDDDPEILSILRDYLENENYVVIPPVMAIVLCSASIQNARIAWCWI